MQSVRRVGRWGAVGALIAAVAAPLALAAETQPTPSLEVRSVSLAANRDVPELCLGLSEAIGHRVNAPLEAFVATDPAAHLSLTAHDRQLCVSGLAFGISYTLTLKSGLPGSLHTLAADWHTQVSVPNRPPEFDFVPPQRIIPRLGPQSIDLRSVNIAKLHVELFHMSDRDLVPHLDPSRPDGLRSSERQDPIWQGSIDIKSDPNHETSTAIPIEKTIGTLQPGVYEAAAEATTPIAGVTPQRQATGYFVVSDLGLIVYRAADSLTVAVRSMASAAGAAGVDVALIGQNNRELARVRTDGSGYARFDAAALKGSAGDRPRAVFAYGAAGEFSWLDLDATASSKLAGVRRIPQLRALVLPQRSDYRAGDEVRMTILLRDPQGHAPSKTPLTVKILRPDGAAHDVRTIDEAGAGGYTASFTLPTSAKEGVWPIRVFADPAGEAIGDASIVVADMPSPRLAVSLSAETALIDPGQPPTVDIRGQYAFGAPASLVPGELDIATRPAANPFPAFADFAFGLADEDTPETAADPTRITTDAGGKASQPLHIAGQPTATRPIEARILGRLLDLDGLPAIGAIAAPVANQPLYFGLKPRGEAVFVEGQPVHFDAIAVGPDGARLEKPDAGWEVRRLDLISDWSWESDRWTRRQAIRQARVAGGSVSIPAGASAPIETTLPAGRYELEIFDAKSESGSSVKFQVGSGADGGTSTVQLVQRKPIYSPGDGVDITVKPPFESDVLLSAADRTLRLTEVQHVPAAGATMHVDIPRDATGALALAATAIAPGSATSNGLPRHAEGSGELPLDPAGERLDVKLEVPEKSQPEQPLPVTVSVAAGGDEPSFVAISAVEDNTRPGLASGDDPVGFFFPKRAAGVALLALLGDGLSDRALTATQSSKASFTKPDDGSPSRPLAVYSGIVALDKTGKAVVPLDIPDFAGKLRITATAWSPSRAGAASAQSTVRWPLATALELPSFLAPDDRLDLDLLLDNTDGPRGEYRVDLSTEGQVTLLGNPEIVANLAEHEQRSQGISIQARAPGSGAILVAVQGPGGIQFQRRFELPVRDAGPAVTRRTVTTIKPDGQLAIDPSLIEGLRPDATTLSIAIDITPPIDPATIVRSLAASDFGPTEQRVSAATHLLASGAAVPIGPILARQRADGSFGQWPDGESNLWLSAYVMDFLGRAKEAGSIVPGGAYRLGLDYLFENADPVPGRDDAVDGPSQAVLEASAYANAVLARAGRIDLPALRFFADRFLPQLHSPLAMAWIASGFAALDDKSTAAAIFARAVALNDPSMATDEFASELRDAAAFAATVAEAGGDQTVLTKVAQKTGDLLAAQRTLTPQEQAWLLRASRVLGTSETPIKLNIDGQSVQHRGPYFWSSPPGQTLHPPAIKNVSGKPLRASIVVTGAPAAAEQHEGTGYEVQRSLIDLQGKPVDPTALKQNDLMLVVLSGRFTGQGDPRPILLDPLPAGWTLEAAEIADPARRYPWLKDLTGANHVSSDAHGLVAVPEIAGDRHEFKFAFVIRAAARGQFALAPALIEDLARPSLSAHSSGGKTKIDPPS